MHDLLSRFFTRLDKDTVMNVLSLKLGKEDFSDTELEIMADCLFSFYCDQITTIDRELAKQDEKYRIL